MPHFEVVRRAVYEEVVTVEADNKEYARARAASPQIGRPQYTQRMDVLEVESVKSEEDLT